MKKSRLIEINGNSYELELLPGKRRSVSLRMLSSYVIEIRYPSYVGVRQVIEYAKGKSSWIEKKARLLYNSEQMGVGQGIFTGRSLFFMGRKYEVVTGGDEITVSGSTIIVPAGSGDEEMDAWYRGYSEEAVEQFISQYKRRIPECTVRVKKQKNIWGSCNTKKRIYINSRISMCPAEVIEYVLWHEICHLAHMNHSAAFYNLLETKCPEYKKHRAWLKRNGLMLRL